MFWMLKRTVSLIGLKIRKLIFWNTLLTKSLHLFMIKIRRLLGVNTFNYKYGLSGRKTNVLNFRTTTAYYVALQCQGFNIDKGIMVYS